MPIERALELRKAIIDDDVVGVQPSDRGDVRMRSTDPPDSFVDCGRLAFIRATTPEVELGLARRQQRGD
jgi:hypothetical protein